MLVLQRRTGEAVEIGNVTVTLLESTKRDTVRIGIEAPPHINIRRTEVKPNTTAFGEVANSPLWDFAERFSQVTTWQQFKEINDEWQDFKAKGGQV